MSTTYISNQVRKQIEDAAANTAEVALKYNPAIGLRKKASVEVCDCPVCGSKDGLEICVSTKKMGIFKCFKCDTGGKGGSAYLQRIYGMDWISALKWLADAYNIQIPDVDERDKKATNNKFNQPENQVSFRDLQLKHSGITDASQKWMEELNATTQQESDRYTPGTMLSDGKFTANGNDMVLHYVGLDNKRVLFTNSKKKTLPLVRVRYQNPELHKSKEGKSMKYRSPYGSGSALWIPQAMIATYTKGLPTETIYIVEGEKKADKMCMHGIPTFGIQGIHNLSFQGEMSRTFEAFIEKCQVKNVVFVLDSDWQDISVEKGGRADQRPYSFFRAVQKFREYFYAYRNSGHHLGQFLVTGLDKKLKGMDDLLVDLSDKADTLKEDLKKAIIDGEGKGDFVQAYKIHPMRVQDFKLKELWNLQTPIMFIQANKERLKEVGDFYVGKLLYYYDEETDEFPLAQQIMPQEQFWDVVERETRNGTVRDYKFDYDRIRDFLFNRGFGLYQVEPGHYRFTKKEGHIFSDVRPEYIQRYVADFADTLEDRDVVKLILRGNTQYLGPSNLNYMRLHQPNWITPRPDEQIMVFKTKFWLITKEGITEKPIAELPGSVWDKEVIDFDPNYTGKPMLTAKKDANGWDLKPTKEFNECELAQYVSATSKFFWAKEYELIRDTDGALKYMKKSTPEKPTKEELQTWKMHIMTKLIAWGYKLRVYRNKAEMRALINMDSLESQVGKSNGGTGKSIHATATRYCHEVFVVDGKTADLKNDRFLYHGVDERTREIIFDDVNVNFQFDLLFSQITSSLRVKPFGKEPITIPSPVFTITTNHALNGDSNSYTRRQYNLGFSDFFNQYRTPYHFFGHQLFDDWDYNQWNLYYNLMATCVSLYMQFDDLGKYGIESGDIERRKLRQQIGEDCLEFFDLYFDKDYMLNKTVVKERVLEDYLVQYPNHRRWMDTKKIKEKARLFATYAGYEFNPHKNGGRDKSNGLEYIILANADFDVQKTKRVGMDTNVRISNFQGF